MSWAPKKQSNYQKHVASHKIPWGKYIWLCSLWNNENPEKSEIEAKYFYAVKDMWQQQKVKPMLSKKQIKYFNDIYEMYQKNDMR